MLTQESMAAWASWRQATCFPDDCFCEAIHQGLIRQPANTWSSLGFVVVAVAVALSFFGDRDRSKGGISRAETSLFIGSLLVVGLGSAFYHASLTFIGQVIDVSGMYLVATFVLLHRLGPRWNLSPVAGVLGFVAVNGLLMVAQVTTPSMRRVAFGILLISAIVVEWRASPARGRWLAIGAGLMALAFAIWILDRWRIVCAPQSLVQGHALWHVLGATAAAALFNHYEGDRTTPGG